MRIASFALLFVVGVCTAQFASSFPTAGICTHDTCRVGTGCTAKDVQVLAMYAVNPVTQEILPDFSCIPGAQLNLTVLVTVDGGQTKKNLGFWASTDGENTQASGSCNHCYQPIDYPINDNCAGFGGVLNFTFNVQLECVGNQMQQLVTYGCITWQAPGREIIPCGLPESWLDATLPIPNSKCYCDPAIVVSNVYVNATATGEAVAAVDKCYRVGDFVTFNNTVCNAEESITLLDVNLVTSDPGVQSCNFASIPPKTCASCFLTFEVPNEGTIVETATVTFGSCSVPDGNCRVPPPITMNSNLVPVFRLTTEINASPNTHICHSGSVTLTASSSGAADGVTVNYLWMPGSFTESSISVMNAGTYTVYAYENNDLLQCNSTASITVSKSAFTVEITGSNEVCAGEHVTLTASNNAVSPQYLWNTQAASQSIAVGVGSYSVTVTDAYGCSASDSRAVIQAPTLSPSISVVPGSGVILYGQAAVLTLVPSYDPSDYTWQWSNGQTNVPSITVMEADEYCVTVTSRQGCTGSSCVFIQVVNPTTGFTGTE